MPVASRKEIFVSPFPGPGPRHQVSTAGGTEPLWSRDGRELFFQEGARLLSVSVSPGPLFNPGPARLLHEGRFLGSINSRTSWSVTPDGRRFLRIQRVAPERGITRLDVTLNWAEELKTRVSSR
jgi:serine/threonine-protein kinase